MNKLIIIGAGGFGREVLWLVNQINNQSPTWDVLGFLDDERLGQKAGGKDVVGTIRDAGLFDDCFFVFALGNPKAKEMALERLPNHLKFAKLIHPNVLVGERILIGDGSVICAGNILTVDIEIGKHVILNLGCTVGHDTRIGDYSSFMPSVNISGEVIIEKGVYVGTGAKIINQLTIGSNTIVGAGAVVSKTLPANCTAVGIPAKPIKFHE